MNATVVVWFTPGPVRWKLWIADRSRTVITYLPGVRWVTRTPFRVSVMSDALFVPTVATKAPVESEEAEAAGPAGAVVEGVAAPGLIQR